MPRLYELKRLAFLALDPIHVGAGGYRLGRVDMTIVREPGTNLPKVPGTSLSGASRSYAAMQYGKLDAAGQQKDLKRRDHKCPILYTFGTTSPNPSDGITNAGAVNLGDARILLFPVASASGPLWVSTPDTLRSAGFDVKGGEPGDDGQVALTLDVSSKSVNLGWLLLPVTGQRADVSPPPYLPAKSAFDDVRKRIALVTPKFFSLIVNNHLEVRTSVSINPKTGAAEEGALFTYEAIPRGTWLTSELVVDNYLELARTKFPSVTKQYLPNRDESKAGEEDAGDPLPRPWKGPIDVVRSGLELIEFLGVGGMGTRGFGRLKTFAQWEAE